MSNLKKIISGKNFIYIGALLLALMLFVVFRQFSQRHGVQKEISDLNAQASSISQKNHDLQNLISYLKTDDYKQRTARQQLGLQKDGEVVYSFAAQAQAGSLNQNSSDVLSAVTAEQAGQQGEPSNPRKWWNYLFPDNKNF